MQLVNQHRASLGLSQLAVTTTAHQRRGLEVTPHGVLPLHAARRPAPPVARGVSDRLLACGYPATTTGWGENIAYGYATANAVMQGWLNSPGHRANIERASYRAIGVAAAASSSGTIYWTQEFGTSTTGGSTPPPPPPPAPVYACSNGADDDSDGKVDYPADPGCASTTDNDEYNAPAPPPPAPSYACSNGRDDDFDGKIDYPADPGCTSTTDNDEYNAAPAPPPPPAPTYACSNGKDDDFDGRIDYPADTGCSGPTDNTETSGTFG